MTRSSTRDRAAGFTLIEMLVSLAITLIMMGAVVTLFGTISESVSGSRSIIEISERLRAARNRLQADLQGVTATLKPPLRPENDEGYFELIEGPMHDNPLQNKELGLPPPPSSTALGDLDDVLMFTVRSRGEPFVGKFGNTTTESQVAEVIYFCAPAQNAAGVPSDSVMYIDAGSNPVRTATLYRRVLLVNPGLAQSPTFNALAPSPSYYGDYDVSARIAEDPSGQFKMVPNSLGDLTKREYRYAHVGTTYPAVLPFDVNVELPNGNPLRNTSDPALGALRPFAAQRLGDDVLLTNVLSFDVQVYDPGAPVIPTAPAAVTPTDPTGGASGSIAGAYVDLGSGYVSVNPPAPQPSFAAMQPGATVLTPYTPASLSFLYGVPGAPSFTYDTWSMHYESRYERPDGTVVYNGYGTDGLDNNNNGVVDDVDEYQTRAPFAASLRGIRVTIRVYEPSSQQVRQVTVVGDFLPD